MMPAAIGIPRSSEIGNLFCGKDRLKLRLELRQTAPRSECGVRIDGGLYIFNERDLVRAQSISGSSKHRFEVSKCQTIALCRSKLDSSRILRIVIVTIAATAERRPVPESIIGPDRWSQRLQFRELSRGQNGGNARIKFRLVVQS